MELGYLSLVLLVLLELLDDIALPIVILFLQPCGHPSFGPKQPVHNFFLCSVASVISPFLNLGQ